MDLVRNMAIVLFSFFLFLFFRFYLFLERREGRRGRGGEGEKHHRVRNTDWIHCLSHTPNWGPGLQPRHRP